MIVCAVIDEHSGMMFNNRRLSQDQALREHILSMCRGAKLWMNAYSRSQFHSPLPENILVDERFLDRAGEYDYCFVENLPLAGYMEEIQGIVLFKWNRVYPADIYFDIPLSESRWRLTHVSELEGSSHKKITKEEWENVERYDLQEMG